MSNGNSSLSSSGAPPAGVVVVSPAGGSTAGGIVVTLNGQNFTSATPPTVVHFVDRATQASTAGTDVTVVAAGNRLSVTQPPLAAGTYDVRVTTDQGTSPVGTTDRFVVGPAVQWVSPNSGPTAGGTAVVISGANLDGATGVDFGTTPGGAISDNTDTSLTVVAPALAAGSYDVTVTTPGGASPTSDVARFFAGATVTGLSPSNGSAASTTSVTVTGVDLDGATAVTFGTTEVTTGITVNAAGTSLSVTAPSGLAQGVVDVVVTTSGNGTSQPSTAAQFLVDPLNVTVENNTGLGGTVPIYAAVFGQLAFDPSTGALVQHPTAGSLSGADLVEVYFDAAGQYAPTAPLYIGHPGPDFANVPTFPLVFSEGVGQIQLPHIYINSARIVFGVNTPPQSAIVNSSGAIAAPALGNSKDPNQTVIYDFLEFTLNENDILFSNTSQVDQVGIPFGVTVDPADPNVPGGVGVLVSRNDMFGAGPSSYSAYLTDVGATGFAVLATYSGSETIGGTDYPYRILAPADYLGLVPTDPLGTYFDDALTTLFTTARTDLTLLVPNPNSGMDAANGNTVNPGDSGVSQYTFAGTVTNNTLSFATTIQSPSGAATVTLTVLYPAAGGTLMVFACDGVFADNVPRYGSPAASLTSLNAFMSSCLGNIENQIVSALHRGIVNRSTVAYANSTLAWVGTEADGNTDHLAYYQSGATADFYAGYLHAVVSETTISQNRLAYGFAYDDQGNQSSTQTSTNPQSITITLGAW